MKSDMGYDYKPYEVVVSILAFALFGVLFAVTELFKSPFIVIGITLISLYPFRKSKIVKIFLTLSVLLFLVWFLHSISGLLLPFILAFLLAYILNPLVEYLGKKNVSRTISSLLIILLFLSIVILLIIFLAPTIAFQFTELIASLPIAIQDLGMWFEKVLLPWAAELGFPTQSIQDKLLNEMPARLEQIITTLLNSLSGLFTGLSIILTQVVNIILIPFLTFYMLKDFNEIKALVKSLFPYSSREKASDYYHKIDNLMGSFLRGSLICAVIHGIGVYIFLAILGVKFSIFLGALSALLNVIPYVGLLLSIFVTVIVALFSGDPGLQIPLVILLYLAQNLLETSYIIPKIIGDRIGLHPALLILSLMVFSYFYGFVGMLIAMPVVSILIMFFKEWKDKRIAREETEMLNSKNSPVT
jgi:predicted PurR-regulated permease PerM